MCVNLDEYFFFIPCKKKVFPIDTLFKNIHTSENVLADCGGILNELNNYLFVQVSTHNNGTCRK